MLYQFGALAIEIAPFNISDISRTGETDFVFKPVLDAEPPAERVGEGGNTLDLSGQLLPQKLGGLDELEVLNQMRVSGHPQYLMRGDGTPLGWMVILSVTDRSTYLNSQGVGQVIAVSIKLRRAKKPSAGSFFSIISGLVR